MPITQKEFKIGLMVNALLEDKYNKTGHMREECKRVVTLYEEKLKTLKGLGTIVSTGFFEYEHEAAKAASLLKREEVDVIIFIELAYQKGTTAMRALFELNVPIIVWNTQLVREFGEDADFDLIMVNSGMAGLSETTSALVRSKKKFFVVSGYIDDKEALEEIRQYLIAAKACARLRNSKIGIIGHPYEGMTDLMQDDFALMQKFGCSVWPIYHNEVTDAFLAVKDTDAIRLIEEQKGRGRKVKVDDEMMVRSAKLALALEQVVKKNSFDAVAEFDQIWLPDPDIGIITFFGTSRLLENHVPFTCEGDVLRAIGMLVLEEVAGHSTFLEHYILDYKRDLMFDSHDGYGNPSLADEKYGVHIVPTIYYKGVNGFGASFNYSYKPGDFTLFSIGSIGEGKFRFIFSEGKNIQMKPREIAAPQTFFQWSGGSIKEFSKRWLYAATSHHHTGAYGRLNDVLGKVAAMLDVECVTV